MTSSIDENSPERIDRLRYQEADHSHTREGEETNLFLTGPAEFLCRNIAELFKEDEIFSVIFGNSIDSYKREDYSIRNFPSMRIYNEFYQKEGETWYINGEITIDVIWPPSIRRSELQQLPDTISSAIVQQFRRMMIFDKLLKIVPGLNELGKIVSVDKSLGFKWETDSDTLAPLTEIKINFRMDLAQWDLYLESDYRTKDYPFERTLGDLKRLHGQIEGLRSDDIDSVDVVLGFDQNIDNG
jgi:hypothetical protein